MPTDTTHRNVDEHAFESLDRRLPTKSHGALEFAPRAAPSSHTPAHTVVTMIDTHDQQDICSTVSVSSGTNHTCTRRRSCRSCLEAAGCMIDSTGTCVIQAVATRNASQDYRHAIANGAVYSHTDSSNITVAGQQAWHFPAHEATYCNSSDSTCRRCIDSGFGNVGGQPDSRFCLGENDCVCIFNCESTVALVSDCAETTESIPALQASSIDISDPFTQIYMIVAAAGLLVVLLLACLFRAVIVNRYLEQEEARLRQQRRRSSVVSVPDLTLSGWRSYQREQIRKEHRISPHIHVEAHVPASPATSYMAVTDRPSANAEPTREMTRH